MIRVGLVTLVATLFIGSLLYYTLHRLDLADSEQREQAVSQAFQQRAGAVSRAFASLSAAVLLVDVAKMQELLGHAWGAEGLADTMLIDTGDRVLAASNSAYVGHLMQDAKWVSIRAHSREWVFVDEPAPGQERVTVFEPVLANGSTIAWARLSFLRTRGEGAVRTQEARLQLVGGLLIPIGVILSALVALVMRLATTRMQQRIKSVVVEAMAEPQPESWDGEALQSHEATAGGGTRRAR